MASSSSLEKSTFVVQLLKLRNFPAEVQRVDCFATFAYETQSLCGVALATGGGITAVGRSLKWQLDNQTLEDIKSIGVSACKLTFCASSGRRIGWVVLDLRTARSNSKKPREEGAWIALSGLAPGSVSVPEAQIKYELNDGIGEDPTARSCPASPMMGRDYYSGRLAHVKNVLESRGLNDRLSSSPPSESEYPRSSLGSELSAVEPQLLPDPVTALSRQSSGTAGTSGSGSPGAALAEAEDAPAPALAPAPARSASAEALPHLPPARQPSPPQRAAQADSTGTAPGTASAAVDSGSQRNTVQQNRHSVSPNPELEAAAWAAAAPAAPAAAAPVAATPAPVQPQQQPWAMPSASLAGAGPMHAGHMQPAVLPVTTPEMAAGQAAMMYGMMPPGHHHHPGMVPGMFNGFGNMGVPTTTGMPAGMMGMPTGNEVRGAWELEMWRSQEEQRFRTELERRAQQRLEDLEAQAQQREASRRNEHTEVCSRYSKLEAKARQVLESLEERETKLYEVERELERKRMEVDRQADRSLLESDKRLAEAEAALHTLRVECNAQLEAERARNADLARQKASAESRVVELEAKCIQLEATIKGLRETYDGSGEGALRDEVAALRSELERSRHSQHKAESKAKKASASRDKYKQQIVRMGHDLGALQQALQTQLSVVLAQQQASLDKGPMPTAREVAGSGPGQMSAQMKQIQELKSNLVTLQASAGANGRPAGAGHSRVPSDESTLSGMSGMTSVSTATTRTSTHVGKVYSAAGGGGGGGGGGDASDGAKGKQLLDKVGSRVEELQRLIGEREMLLSSGAYSKGDKLIVELDSLIVRMMGKSGGS